MQVACTAPELVATIFHCTPPMPACTVKVVDKGPRISSIFEDHTTHGTGSSAFDNFIGADALHCFVAVPSSYHHTCDVVCLSIIGDLQTGWKLAVIGN